LYLPTFAVVWPQRSVDTVVVVVAAGGRGLYWVSFAVGWPQKSTVAERVSVAEALFEGIP